MADSTGDTTSSTYAGLVKTVYDKYVEYALRSEPLFRAVADKRVVDQAMAGNVITLSRFADLAAVTGNLTEGTDVTAVYPSDTTTKTITLRDYGNVVNHTEFLDLTSFTAVDPALANLVAYNMRDSIDQIVRAVLIGGTNVVTSNAGERDASAQNVNTLVATDIMSTALARYCVTRLRANSAQPVKDGLYAAFVHPDTSYDIRSESGAGGWVLPHQYQAGNQIWAGEIGTYEGAFYIETPRAYQAADGSSSAVISRTILCGKQALAEAVAREFGLVIGPVVDSLMRERPIGWKGTAGWARYREEALYRVAHGSSVSQ
jgi:N4-gp56 family major capsid protein